MSTTEATGPWTILNSGIVCTTFFWNMFFTGYFGQPPLSDVQAQIAISGSEPPAGNGDSISIVLLLTDALTGQTSEDTIGYVYPNGIQVFDGFLMRDAGTGILDPDLPNEVIITPAVWNL